MERFIFIFIHFFSFKFYEQKVICNTEIKSVRTLLGFLIDLENIDFTLATNTTQETVYG